MSPTTPETETFDEWNERLVREAHAHDTAPKDPFERVGGQYGAPHGRAGFGRPADAAGIRLLKGKWVDYDYDAGGAYWGRTPGQCIYAAVDTAAPCQYLAYTRASSRAEAAASLGLSSSQLLKPL